MEDGNPADDLLTAMIDAEDGGDRMSKKELRDQVELLFVAGHETTVNLIGTGLYELSNTPSSSQSFETRGCRRLRSTNSFGGCRRCRSAVASRRRTLPLRGKQIPKGTFVLTSLAAANHDPEFWGDTAETLDLHRENAGQHVSFGSGVHYCLGASLAKLEAEVAIGSFVQRFGQVDIVGEPVWNGRINLRGLESLIVDLT